MKINKDKKFLAQRCVEVPEQDIARVSGVLKRELFLLPNAYGLASNQLGLRYRAFAMRIQKPRELGEYNYIDDLHIKAIGGILTFINPIILDSWGTAPKYEEKCLSLKKTFKVPRRSNLSVTDDLVMKGKRLELYGKNAQIFQHEMDHLNGITIETRSKL